MNHTEIYTIWLLSTDLADQKHYIVQKKEVLYAFSLQQNIENIKTKLFLVQNLKEKTFLSNLRNGLV